MLKNFGIEVQDHVFLLNIFFEIVIRFQIIFSLQNSQPAISFCVQGVRGVNAKFFFF